MSANMFVHLLALTYVLGRCVHQGPFSKLESEPQVGN